MPQPLYEEIGEVGRARPASQPVAVDGVLVAALELDRRFSSYQPADRLFLFRSDEAWHAITLRRTEHWADEGGTQWPASGKAWVSAEELGSLDSVAEALCDRYGQSGWREVLEAGHRNDPDLYCRWIPTAIEADLDAAVFFRRNLAGRRSYDALTLGRLRRDIEAHLAEAGFRVVTVQPPPRQTRRGENLVLARAVVRRYGHDIAVIVRMDSAGEVYPRLVDRDDAFGLTMWSVPDDDR